MANGIGYAHTIPNATSAVEKLEIEKIEKAERLDQCIETIRQRFGKNSIRNGILFQNLRMPSEKPEITMPTGVLC